MRGLLVCGMLAGLSLLPTPAAAQGAWCSEDMNSRNCGWYTLEQCRAGASGNGGSCFPNAFAPKAAVVEPRKRATRAPPHH
jgi:Protein of unknown function (DUF3551)